MAWFVYMVQCADKSLYTGVTTDVERRMAEHNAGVLGAKYTKTRRPVTLVYQEACESRGEAQKREAGIKQLSRPAKLKLLDKS